MFTENYLEHLTVMIIRQFQNPIFKIDYGTNQVQLLLKMWWRLTGEIWQLAVLKSYSNFLLNSHQNQL